jgi:hypothetical protein
MSKKEKLLAVLHRLSQIPLQQCKVLEIDISKALAQTSDEEIDFYFKKLVKER